MARRSRVCSLFSPQDLRAAGIRSMSSEMTERTDTHMCTDARTHTNAHALPRDKEARDADSCPRIG